MGTLMEGNKRTARRKGAAAAAATTAGLVLAVVVNPIVGVLGLVGAGYLTYDWFMFRAKRGMRF